MNNEPLPILLQGDVVTRGSGTAHYVVLDLTDAGAVIESVRRPSNGSRSRRLTVRQGELSLVERAS